MRTAEEILKVITCNGCREIEEERALQAMKEYANEVAREALKNAAENSQTTTIRKGDSVIDYYITVVDKQSILNEKNIPEI